MIVYKDKTFCKNEECKHFGTCTRAVYDTLFEEAEDFGLPVAVFQGQPSCFEREEEE